MLNKVPGTFGLASDGLKKLNPKLVKFKDKVFDSPLVKDIVGLSPLKLAILNAPAFSVTVYGRSNMGNDLVNITSTVNNSYVRIVLNPAQKTPTTTYAGAKVIFSATYFQTQNALQGGAAELINSGNNLSLIHI